MSEHLTHAQAQQQTHAYAQQSMSALPQSARLDFGYDNDLPCSDEDGAPPSTPVSVQSYYTVTGLASASHRRSLADVVDFWTKRGWDKKVDQRPGEQFVTLGSGGYEIVLQLSVDGSRFSLTTTSPCVAPNAASAAPGG